MPRFSIVVPIYNVEAYIQECLDSLLGQSFGDFEVICVDDASPDDSASIVQSYCLSDSRIRLVRNDRNMHLFASRHVGVRETTGEYVLFVDGDDKLTYDALETIDKQLLDNPVDILQFPMKAVVDPQSDAEMRDDGWYCHRSEPRILRGDEIVGKICYEQAEDMCAHHRAYRGDMAREVLEDLGYESDLYSAEDIVELTALMLAADTYQVIDSKPLYIYYVGRGLSEFGSATTLDAFLDNAYAKHRCYENLMRYLERKGINDVSSCVPIAWRWRYSCAQTLLKWQYSLSLDDRIDALEKLVELWPCAWVVPSICTFVADEAMAFIEGTCLNDGGISKRSFVSNMQCLALAFLHYNENQAYSDITFNAWNDMYLDLDSSGFFINDEIVDNGQSQYLLRCLYSICLFLRSELWTTDDRAIREKYELRQLKEVLNEKAEKAAWAENSFGSKLYKMSKKTAAFSSAIRDRGNNS